MVTSFDHPWINREERILEFWPQMGCVGGCYIFRYTVGWQSNVHSSFSTCEFLADFHLVSFLDLDGSLCLCCWNSWSILRVRLESACLGNFRQGFHFSLSVFSSIKKVGNVQLRSGSWVVRVESCLRLGTQQVVCFSLSFLTPAGTGTSVRTHVPLSLSEEIIVETSELSNKYEEGAPFKKAHVWGPLDKKFGLCLES